MLEAKGYLGSANDIFACGVILFIFANAYPPFKEAKVKDPWYKNLYNVEPKKFWELHAKRLVIKSESFKTLITGMLAKSNRYTMEEILNSEWFNGELPTKEELINDLTSRKKVVDSNKKRQSEEKLKVKSGGSDNKVYRGEGDDIYIEKVIEMINNIDLSNYRIRSFGEFNYSGKFSVLNFIGDSENDMSIGKVFKILVLSLKKMKAEVELIEGFYHFNVVINNYKYFEDEIEVEEDISVTVELYSNGEFSSNAVVLRNEDTNLFTFKRFIDSWKSEFNTQDE